MPKNLSHSVLQRGLLMRVNWLLVMCTFNQAPNVLFSLSKTNTVVLFLPLYCFSPLKVYYRLVSNFYGSLWKGQYCLHHVCRYSLSPPSTWVCWTKTVCSYNGTFCAWSHLQLAVNIYCPMLLLHFSLSASHWKQTAKYSLDTWTDTNLFLRYFFSNNWTFDHQDAQCSM